jgi:hypothetical protein
MGFAEERDLTSKALAVPENSDPNLGPVWLLGGDGLHTIFENNARKKCLVAFSRPVL